MSTLWGVVEAQTSYQYCNQIQSISQSIITRVRHSSTSPRHSVKSSYTTNLPIYITSRPQPVKVILPNLKTEGIHLALYVEKPPTYLHILPYPPRKRKTSQPDYLQYSTLRFGMFTLSLLPPSLLPFSCAERNFQGGVDGVHKSTQAPH